MNLSHGCKGRLHAVKVSHISIGWAPVGVRFHIQHAFVINLAANSPCPRPTRFSFTDDSVDAVHTFPARIGEQLGSSNQGPGEWAEAGGQHPHVLHSLFTVGILGGGGQK